MLRDARIYGVETNIPRPNISILVPHTSTALGSGDVTCQLRRISCHAYGRARVRHGLRPPQVSYDRIVFDLVVVGTVQNDEASLEGRCGLGMDLGPGWAAHAAEVADEYVVMRRAISIERGTSGEGVRHQIIEKVSGSKLITTHLVVGRAIRDE